MNIKSANLDSQLPSGGPVGPKAVASADILPEGVVDTTPKSTEFAGLPNFSDIRSELVVAENVPAVCTIDDGFWLVDAEGDLVRRSSIMGVRVDRSDGRYKVVGVTERMMVITLATLDTIVAANEFRLAVAKVVMG